eukprot:2932038-Rhodomonas_salina.1
MPSGPSYPMLQMHEDMLGLPVGESEFTGQEAHTDSPVTFMYVPAGQVRHADPAVTFRYVPASH